VMSAAKYQLNNLIGVIDRNYIQISGNTEQVMPLGSLAYKYQSFGWQVIEIDGHSYQEIYNAFVLAQQAKDKPLIIIANTIPGKGVKEFEYDHTWHGKAPDEKQAKQALAQLKKYV